MSVVTRETRALCPEVYGRLMTFTEPPEVLQIVDYRLTCTFV
jgi:hypothetical protein